MTRSEHHSREVVEADRAELLRMIREPIDRGAGTFGEDGYRPAMESEPCLGCGAEIHGGNIPECVVCGRLVPWREEYGAYLAFERRPHRPEQRAADIREAFEISPTAYEVRVARMLEDPRALTVDAVTVRRLQRRRDARLRGGENTASSRPMPRQRPLDFPSRPGTTSPASVLTSTPSGAEGTAESRATETGRRQLVDDVAAAGDTSSEGVRARVENDRVWGRRDRLQLGLRPLGEHLRSLLKLARDLWWAR